MSFLDKMKSGMNQVKDKAAQTVEVTRINAQISGRKKEKDAYFEKLGKLVYEAYSAGQLPNQMDAIDTFSKTIAQIDADIGSLENQLLRVKGERTCSCGAVVPFDSKFCNSCGQVLQPLETPAIPVKETENTVDRFCTSCGAGMEGEAKFCTSCGAKAE